MLAYAVYAHASAWIPAFRIAVPGITMRCQQSHFANDYTLAASAHKDTLLVHVRQGKSDYMVMSDGKLMLSNTLDSNDINETVYHALNISKQLQLAEGSLEVMLCGDVNREQAAVACRFFPRVTLYRGRPLKVATAEMSHVMLHQYATVI